MLKAERRIAAAVLITVLGIATAANAAETVFLADGVGSVSGRVLNSAGAPATGCVIRFFAPPDYSGEGGTGGGKGGKSSGDLRPSVRFLVGQFYVPSPLLLQGKGTPAAQAVCDEKGNFQVKALKVGTYRYIAGNRNIGLAGGNVTIEAAKAATLEAKLNVPSPR